MKLRFILKRGVQGLALILVFIPGLLSGFGRNEAIFTFFAQLLALVPGVPGSFCRVAFYRLTLEACSIDSNIGFGSFFSRRRAIIARHVSIGGYCIIGPVQIGAKTQISSHVEIPAARQHTRNSVGLLSDSSDASDCYVIIGEDCWIGASATIMANVGSQSTIGAGSVVVKDIPSGVVAVGVPAKPIKRSVTDSNSSAEHSG